MNITLARIDDRLIHGQVTTRNIRTKPFFIFSLAHRMP